MSQDIGNSDSPMLGECRRPVWSSPLSSIEGRTQAEVARTYGVSQGLGLASCWPATGPRARPRSSPGRGGRRPHRPRPPTATVELILRLRKELAEAGLDAGPDTIGWHLAHHHQVTVSRATITRILTRAGVVIPEPKKRPKSSYLRFEAEHAERDLAVRLHPLPAHRPDGHPARTSRSSPGSTTTPATPCTSPPTPGSPARSCSPPSAKPQTSTGIPPPR